VAAFLARRVAQGLAVVVLVVTIVFFLVHALPGDPFSSSMEDPRVSESVRAAWQHSYGLDRSLGEQYVRYIGNALRGNLGFSFFSRRPVSDALKSAFPNTLLLMSVALAGGFLIGIAVAVAQVRRHGRPADRLLGGISIFLFSVPDFWLALLMLIGAAALIPGVFPIGGIVDQDYDTFGILGKIGDRLRHLALPALTLSLLYFPIIARHQRAALLEAMTADYITTGRAKGVSEKKLVSRHALRNSLLPIVTILGVAFPALLTGAVFIEKIFSWPGMGWLTVRAIDNRDYPLVIGGVLFGSAFVVAGIILSDVLYRVLDPRQRDEL
jgi:peptide/nickel transport system permease protein